jgi:glycosyltransferase involved in cell wall biosynthesis
MRKPEPMGVAPNSRLRVLVIAEACNPAMTSVPLVGYNIARALAERPELDLTVITQVRNQSRLQGDPLTERARVEFLDNEFVTRPLSQLSHRIRGGNSLSWTVATAMAYPAYIIFERMVYRRFRDRLRQGEFDVVHRITPLSPTVGSPLAGWVKPPMLIGPLNGGLPWPKEFPELVRQEREWLVPLRGAYRFLPYYRSTYRHLSGVIAGSRYTATEVPAYFRGRRYYLPENGLDPARFPLADAWPEPGERFQFITVGRLVPYKGMDLILEAMHGSTTLKSCALRIVGEGPMRDHLEELTRRYDLEGQVSFAGRLDQRALAEELGRSQAFVFPSLREFGGGVVLEAMARGLPTIVVDYGGPAELISPDDSIGLAMAPRERLVPALREAMESLAADPQRCRRMGAAACHRIRTEFTWSVKAARITEIYRDLLDSSSKARA